MFLVLLLCNFFFAEIFFSLYFERLCLIRHDNPMIILQIEGTIITCDWRNVVFIARRYKRNNNKITHTQFTRCEYSSRAYQFSQVDVVRLLIFGHCFYLLGRWLHFLVSSICFFSSFLYYFICLFRAIGIIFIFLCRECDLVTMNIYGI